MRRSAVSAYTANKDLRYLRATFNFGIKRDWITCNPTARIDFLPVDKTERYVPPLVDLLKVISAADPDTKDYLWVLKEIMARVGEVNQLTWSDVHLGENFSESYVVLYTRKKKGGHRTPRRVPMTARVYDILKYRYVNRDKSKPWVFWHRYWSRNEGAFVEGPFRDRKRIMSYLCERAGVKYFRFHAIRHLGASTLDAANVSIGSIQRILGHENRTTTEIYLHSIGEAEREAMDIFAAVCETCDKKSHTFSHTSG